jgi:dTMP kinase
METERVFNYTPHEINKIRGKWIVVEGPDRIGKTTLINALVQKFTDLGLDVMSNGFPRRNTTIGQILDKSLKVKEDEKTLSGKTQTMLFLTDMMDSMDSIKQFLESGGVVLTDRYVMSTYAYALAQYSDTISKEWLYTAISLLPEPSLYVLLTPVNMSLDFISKRSDYGNENTERLDIQARVLSNMVDFSKTQKCVVDVIVGEYTTTTTICDLFVLPRILNHL